MLRGKGKLFKSKLRSKVKLRGKEDEMQCWEVSGNGCTVGEKYSKLVVGVSIYWLCGEETWMMRRHGWACVDPTLCAALHFLRPSGNGTHAQWPLNPYPLFWWELICVNTKQCPILLEVLGTVYACCKINLSDWCRLPNGPIYHTGSYHGFELALYTAFTLKCLFMYHCNTRMCMGETCAREGCMQGRGVYMGGVCAREGCVQYPTSKCHVL